MIYKTHVPPQGCRILKARPFIRADIYQTGLQVWNPCQSYEPNMGLLNYTSQCFALIINSTISIE